MGACLSDPVDAVCRTEILLLQQQLDAKIIESTDYQKGLLEAAYIILNDRIAQASEEVSSVNATVLKMQQGKEIIEASKADEASEFIIDASPSCLALPVDEFINVTTLSLVCFYGKGKPCIDILPENGEPYHLPSILDCNNNWIGTTALVHIGDRVKFSGYDNPKVGYMVPFKK
jgi:hypothetical protein